MSIPTFSVKPVRRSWVGVRLPSLVLLWGRRVEGRTWTSTLTLEPRRARIVSSKLLAVILGGAIIASLSLIAAGVTASLWIPASDHPFSQANLPGGPTLSDLWAQVLRTAPAMIAATVLIAILWTALGFLIETTNTSRRHRYRISARNFRLIAATVPNLARWLPEWAAQGDRPASRPPPSRCHFRMLLQELKWPIRYRSVRPLATL